MAPILATATGLAPPASGGAVERLRRELCTVDAANLRDVLAAAGGESCFCEEQVDLHHWIEPLNNLDRILRSLMEAHPQMLLLPPVPRFTKLSKAPDLKPAASLAEATAVPPDAIAAVVAILSFWAALLRSATCKFLFNSVEECCDLLGAASDDLVDAALAALRALALPPALHKQQAPEAGAGHHHHHHGTMLSAGAHPACLARLTALARGHTSRAAGLGLYQLLTAPRPPAPAVHFSYYAGGGTAVEEAPIDGEPCLQEIVLEEQEVLVAPEESCAASGGTSTKKRRRVTAHPTTGDDSAEMTRSTAELFFLALSKAKGKIHSDRLFALLADIRWARSQPVVGVNRRLAALVCILHSHPSQDVMNGYFAAQPELGMEVVDLLRPTVSANAVSSAAAAQLASRPNRLQQDGISGLADTQVIPYSTRMLALEVLAALVSRRDGSSGALSGSMRLSNVLLDLGVGKGQYLGLLPTLIRYSLASLGNPLANKEDIELESDSPNDASVLVPGLQLGLAFVEATILPQPPRILQVQQALAMIDNVLTLTSAVIAAPSGASSLIDCGLIPALLTTISTDTDATFRLILRDEWDIPTKDASYIKAQLRCITAQAIQILEGAVVSSNGALASFHDLNGVDVLTDRFGREISLIQGTEMADQEGASDPMELDNPNDASMNSAAGLGVGLRISPAQRVLLFSIVTCLTVVCHQENASSTAALPSGGSQLRKPEVTAAVILILDRVDSFGGHLASLVATLLSDIMNNDPQIVHYIHMSGIARSFLSMVADQRVGEFHEPKIPPVAELIMAIPNVLAALALTENGAKAVKDAAPFPSLLRLFYHPDFAMPRSRCLLNDMTAIFGTGLDEIMRHVESLKTDILLAITEAIRNVIKLADELSSRESRCEQSSERGIEDERTCLIQYVLNFSQLLEQILHNEDHCEPFVEAGGLDGLLELFPASMPGGMQLLTHISSSSSLAISTVHHSTIEDTLSLAIKCILFRYNPFKLVHKICETVSKRMDAVEASHRAILGENIYFLLDEIQRVPFYKLDSASQVQVNALADFLKNVALLQWITNILAVTIKSLCQRSQEAGTDGWSASEQEWKKEIISSAFATLTGRLADFHFASLFEVCRVRSENDFEEAERARLTTRIRNLVYRLRIVCPEGAVVREGIEIDSSASLGSMEMGEIVQAYDRCINMSGIMRWRTSRGWISEMTRGHGREPIAEVLEVMENEHDDSAAMSEMADDKRIEAVIPDLRFVALGMLARGQSSFCDLFTELSKFSVHMIRSVTSRTIGFEEGGVGHHASIILRVLGTNLVKGMNIHYIRRQVFPDDEDGSSCKMSISPSGVAMYYGAMMHLIQSSLFDDRRERRLVNLALMVHLVSADPHAKSLIFGEAQDAVAPTLRASDEIGIFGMCSLAFDQGMRILSNQLSSQLAMPLPNNHIQQFRSVGRSIAASFPSLLSLLRSFISASISSSPVASVMSRMKWMEIPKLVGKTDLDARFFSNTGNDGFFEPERFLKFLYLGQSRLLRQALQSDKLISVPAHLMHPLVNAVCDLINVLSEASKTKVSQSSRMPRNDNTFSLSEYFQFRRQSSIVAGQEEEFEPDESSIALLMEMGFTRERAVDALEATRSNRVDVAMEYALTHPPPSPETVERRRLEREQRRRARSLGEAETRASSVSAANGEREGGSDPESEPIIADDTAMGGSSREPAEPGQMEGQKAVTEGETVEDDIVIRCKTEVASWLGLAPTVFCRILAGVNDLAQHTTIDNRLCDGEIEGLTVVLSAFILDLCSRFPEKCPNLLFNVFHQLKEEIGDSSVIASCKEASIAAFCHAALLCTRAVPKSRIFILHNNLLAPLLTMIKDASDASVPGQAYPIWLVPALLLVDVMAQPVVGFMDEEIIKSMLEDSSVDENSELDRVRGEHKSLTQRLDRTTRKLFSAFQSNSDSERGDILESNLSSTRDSATSKDGTLESPDLGPRVPAYFPLIPQNLLEGSVEICRALLGINKAPEKIVEPPPAVAHATLLLFLHLLGMPNVPASSRSQGTVEAILSLPGSSKFKGNDILVALVLRRYLEDAATLQASMETEMRGALAKLQAKRRHAAPPDQVVEINLDDFVDAVKPLLCRDSITFIKAMVLTVKIKFSSENGPLVFPLSNEERLKNQTILAVFDAGDQSCQRAVHTQHSSKSRGRSPYHKKEKERRSLSSSKKSIKKEKQVATVTSNHHMDNSSAEASSTQVMSLLMHSVFSTVLNDNNESSMIVRESDPVESLSIDKEFLWLANLLDIMTEIILAIPTCASAVHNYRPSRMKDKALRMALSCQLRHSLSGCPDPPKTFINFLLHVILPQDRWSIRNDSELWDKRKAQDRHQTERSRAKKIKAYRTTKSSQAAARMLLVLAARPGEGRKRVITDLAFALSGGRFGHGFTCQPDSESSGLILFHAHFHARELLALQAWGELLSGLVAPRHSGKPVSSIGSLSLENIRVMLDVGVVHSLLYALHRVELSHPMAPVSCAHLLQPFECLTRKAVSDSVRALIDKEKNFGMKGVETKVTISEVDALSIPKDLPSMDAGDETVSMANGDNEEDSVVISSSSDESTDDEEEEDEEQSENSDEDDVESIDEDEGDDEEMESSDSETDDDVHDGEQGHWNVDEEDDVRIDDDDMQQDLELADEEVMERIDQSLDDGWTRIESSGPGGHQAVSVGGSTGVRMRGFVDAAEAMIGSLLRHGEISSEAMDEIGETLGVRLGANQRHSLQSMMLDGELNLMSSVNPQGQQSVRVLREAESVEEGRRRELISSLPQVQQRGQPNDTFSSFGGSRHGDINSMEYVFGGPTVTSAGRNYSLVSTDSSSMDQQTCPPLTQLDLQLFPEGPGLVTGSRTTLPLHPLLWGVDLPPLNSVVSDLESHGAAAVHERSTSRRPVGGTSSGTGGVIVSMTNGNIIRSFARSHSGALVASGLNGRSSEQPTGWLDDNVQTDSNVQRFTTAFQRRLANSLRPPPPSTDTVNASVETSSPPADPAPSQDEAAMTGEADITDNTNDGDMVASSLAEGLRLSSGSTRGRALEQVAENLDSVRGRQAHESSPVIEANESQSAEEPTGVVNIPTEVNSEVPVPEASLQNAATNPEDSSNVPSEQGNDDLVCPPDIDVEVFNSLPVDMQRECISQYNATRELARDVVGSSLDPEVLAALPEDVRREVIEQERQERRMREQEEAPADPSNAAEMDNASFIASLAPQLREEILMTADEEFLNSLPPSIIAEAQLLRERAAMHHRQAFNERDETEERPRAPAASSHRNNEILQIAEQSSSRRNRRYGKIKIEVDRPNVIYLPESLSNPLGRSSLAMLIQLMYLISPVRPSRLLQRVFYNIFSDPKIRSISTEAFIRLLHGDREGCLLCVESLRESYGGSDDWRDAMDKLFPAKEFPPSRLLGSIPEVADDESNNESSTSSKRKSWPSAAAAIAANLPPFIGPDNMVPPVVSVRLIDTMLQLCKASPRYCVYLLSGKSKAIAAADGTTGYERLLDLLAMPMFTGSSTNLEQLLSLLEAAATPLSLIPKIGDEEIEISQKEIDSASSSGKEWADIPRVAISQQRLQFLCSILRMETCRESSFTKVNTIVRRLCRVETNRAVVLGELASVAHALGADAVRDLRALKIRMNSAASHHHRQISNAGEGDNDSAAVHEKLGHVASSVTLSTSSSELKLLRVLQTLQSLCVENWDESGNRKSDNSILVTEELVHLFKQLDFSYLWDELSSCLAIVQVLEGVKAFEDEERMKSEAIDTGDDVSGEDDDQRNRQRKKLRNSAAGLLTRFLPSIEAFFVVNASAIKDKGKDENTDAGATQDIQLDDLVDGQRVITFVATNKVLLNALLRNNSGLIDKGLRVLVQVPRFRSFLDFDVKRQWFKAQVRRLRQQASRRHGSLRLHIRRKHVFEDAYHQLRLRNAEEMRGRLHVTFRNEEGVDAGGLSREFFAILAKEMFNPNYALFTSTEDGCTFQPNPNSSINPDHLSYFRFVGRIVGKALADGYLLDAHFTRSLYKHMLGLTPTYHDMEAIDPDYYRNLKTILEYSLADIGLDLTFSIEDHSFGRSQTIDLVPQGRRTPVTDDTKEEYVRLVCQHRMTTAIRSQIRAYLDGFHEMVGPDLIAVFSPRELELLISGLPDIDAADLKAHTDYVGWKATDPEIIWFWNILFSLSRNERAAFLQFVTGSSKVPLGGFGELQGMRGNQRFSIHKVANKKGALMSAHTCFNQLDLPTYDSEEEMRSKLLFAINEGGGAFLFA